jgi:hypothetical protein
MEEALKPVARRRAAHQQRRAAVDRSLPDRRLRQPRQHAARDIRVRKCRERRLELRPRGIFRDLLLDLGQRVAYERIDARAVWRQRGEVVVVHDVHELERGVHRAGQPGCHAGSQE